MSSGNRRTVGVAGWYWMSSQTSVRATTAPGVTARSLPTWNASGSTMVGMCGAEDMSEMKARTPRRRLRPPLSMYAFHATGLRYGLLLGADAAMRLVSTNFSRSLSRQSSSASASRASELCARARYAWRVRLSSGFPLHAGSENRRSRRSGAIAELPMAMPASSAASLAYRAATVPGRLASRNAYRTMLLSGRNRRTVPRAASGANRSSAPTASSSPAASVASNSADSPAGREAFSSCGRTELEVIADPLAAAPRGAVSCRWGPSAGQAPARQTAGTCTAPSAPWRMRAVPRAWRLRPA